jgi:hypothetical protein
VPRFGIMPSWGGVRKSTESDQKAQCQGRTHCMFSNQLAPILRGVGAAPWLWP